MRASPIVPDDVAQIDAMSANELKAGLAEAQAGMGAEPTRRQFPEDPPPARVTYGDPGPAASE